MSKEWNGSSVMKEFYKIAKDEGLISVTIKPEDKKDFVGNPSTPTPVKDHKRYEPTKEYGVTKGDGDDIIEKAHPHQARPVEGAGDGGVVENLIEQQQKDIEVATSMPTGALTGKHAELLKNLIKLANALEDNGKYKEAHRVDETIKRLAASAGPIEFAKPIPKGLGAAFSLLGRVPGMGLLGGLAGGVMGYSAAIGAVNLLDTLIGGLTDYSEEFATDLHDLVEILQKAEKEPQAASAASLALKLLYPFESSLSVFPSLENHSALAKYKQDFDNFVTKFPSIKRLALQAGSDAGYAPVGSKLVSVMTGMNIWGIKARMERKIETVEKQINNMRMKLSSISAVLEDITSKVKSQTESGQTGLALSGDNDVVGIQKILNRGYGGKKWDVPLTGVIDENTKSAIREFESAFDSDLESLGEKQRLAGKLLRLSPDQIATLIKELESRMSRSM